MSLAATRDIRTPEFRAYLDKFKVFRVEEGSHWRGPNDSSFVLHTAAWLPLQYVKNIADYTHDTPYTLEKELAGLFPEWYFHLIRNFARRSAFHSFYCSKTRAEFLDFLQGPDVEKEMVTLAMDWEFSSAFRAGLGPQLDEIFGSEILSRSVVESAVVQELVFFVSWTTVAERTNLLVSKAILGDVIPYTFFLMAYDCSENYIWMTVAGLLLKKCHKNEHVAFLQQKLDILRTFQTPIVGRLRQFVAYLNEGGILPRKKAINAESPSPVSVKRRKKELNGINAPELAGKNTTKPKIKAENGNEREHITTLEARLIPKLLRGDNTMLSKEDRDAYAAMKNPNHPLYSEKIGAMTAATGKTREGKLKLKAKAKTKAKAKAKAKAKGPVPKRETLPANIRRPTGREREQELKRPPPLLS